MQWKGPNVVNSLTWYQPKHILSLPLLLLLNPSRRPTPSRPPSPLPIPTMATLSMQLSFFLDHVAPYGTSSYGAPPGAAPYEALPHAGYAAPNAAPTHAGCAAPKACLRTVLLLVPPWRFPTPATWPTMRLLPTPATSPPTRLFLTPAAPPSMVRHRHRRKHGLHHSPRSGFSIAAPPATSPRTPVSFTL
jgi:hypothetical protein